MAAYHLGDLHSGVISDRSSSLRYYTSTFLPSCRYYGAYYSDYYSKNTEVHKSWSNSGLDL